MDVLYFGEDARAAAFSKAKGGLYEQYTHTFARYVEGVAAPPLVSALAAIALALSMTPLLAALAQVDLAYAEPEPEAEAPAAVVAPLNDHGKDPSSDTNTDMRPKDYACTQTTVNGIITVTLTGSGLDKHYNGLHNEAYWVGIGIPYTSNRYKLELGYGEYSTDAEVTGSGEGSVDFEEGGFSYTSVYFKNEVIKSQGGWVRVWDTQSNSVNPDAVYQIYSEITNNYAIEYAMTNNGTVSGDEKATEGDEVTVTVTPGKGYGLKALMVTGITVNEVVEVTDDTFIMPSFDVNVAATFTKLDTSKLEAAVKAANEDLDSTKVSTDGSDIDPADKWTTQADRDTFTQFVSTASSGITMLQSQDEIDEAVTTLEAAQKAFDGAKKPGTKGAAVPVTSVTLDKTTAALTVGETLELKATVEPEDATDADVDWDSSDLSVATVDGAGIVTAVDTGTATITAKAGDKSATCEVTVTAAEPESVVMHRLYNPNSGEHFYTSDDEEYKNLTALGWQDEGIGWNAPKLSGTPVYRLYNPNAGEHHYTMDAQERDSLVGFGWNDEGIGWYSDDAKGVPVYREYNPNEFANNHNYTADKDEHYKLLGLGWIGEGLAWYGVATS